MSSSNSPLPPDKLLQAQNLAVGLTPDQAKWLAGFYAGIGFATGGAIDPTPAAGAKPPLTVLYGSESGNAEKLSGKIQKVADKAGFKSKVVSMGDAKAADLKKSENLLVVVSTWGEGDPPDAAIDYYEEFMGKDMPKLDGLKFSVCGLGDTSYEHFCKMGKDFDTRLEALGAERAHERVDCDVDFQADFDKWLAGAIDGLPSAAVADVATQAAVAPSTVEYSKTNPYEAEVLEKIVLNGTGSAKETLHLELSLEESGLTYQPGDALGIYPVNRKEDVDAILLATGLKANAKLGEQTLVEALETNFDITSLSPAIAMKYNGIVASKSLETAIAEKAAFKDWIWGRQLVDLIEAYPHKEWTPESFTSILRPLAARLGPPLRGRGLL